jgi:hypothetical protein
VILDSAWPYLFVGVIFLLIVWLESRYRRRDRLRRTPFEIGYACMAVAGFVFCYLGGSLTGMAVFALWFVYNVVLFWTHLRSGRYR